MVELSKIDEKDESLIFTGERYQPEIGGDVQLEHLHRYAMARGLVENKTVLDIACGEGYGSTLLAETANKVTGVDIELKAVEHARVKYKRDNLSFLEGDCAKIPIKENSVDVVVSFETIEHHDQHIEMMEEIKRVLKPEGFIVISSPNKKEYSDIPGYDNPYHIKELYSEEFEALVEEYFENVQTFRQRVIYASAVIAENTVGDMQSFEVVNGETKSLPNFRSIYDIIVASNVKLPEISHSLFEVDTAVVTEGHLKHITALSNTLDSVISDRDSVYETISTVESNFKSELSKKEQHITELTNSLENVVKDRDSAYEARQSVEENFKTELSQKEQHITELTISLEDVVKDRDSAYEARQSVEENFKKKLSQKDQHITTLATSIEAVVKDRDSAYQAISLLEESREDINWKLAETERYSQEIERELNATKATFIWKVFGRFIKGTSGKTRGG